MKVLHLCYLPLCEDHPDFGRLSLHPGSWVLHLARAQARHANIQPELAIQVPGAMRDHHTAVDGIPLHFLRAPARLRSLTLFLQESGTMGRLIRHVQPDLVHAHGVEDSNALAAQRSGLPHLLTIQGIHSLIHQRSPFPLFSRAQIIRFTEALCLRRARRAIAKSAYVEEYLRQHYPRLRLHRIPNTYDPDLLAVRETRVKNAIVFVGTISPWKGVHFLRKAIGMVKDHSPDMQLWIIGNDSTQPSDYQNHEIVGLQKELGNNLKLFGILSPQKTQTLIASASLMVAPSLEDMFGNQVMEALLLGTQVLVHKGTALAEQVQQFGQGEVVDAAVPKSFAIAMTEALIKKQSFQASEAAMDYYSPERVARLHRELYLEILSEKRA